MAVTTETKAEIHAALTGLVAARKGCRATVADRQRLIVTLNQDIADLLDQYCER